ncbi:hypothetical protein [Massilia sp. TN1-12]|uniref:hypothetical protein n=1 Tax=Massilia paldalensis TaxID=3377675 RepID=UPI00384D025F
MSENIEHAKPNFKDAIIHFEKSNSCIEPMPVSYTSFTPLGGKTDALGQGYLYELTEIYGDQVPLLLSECRRVIGITMMAWVGLPNDLSMAWRAVVAVLDGSIESSFFKPSMEQDEVVDFLDFMVLFYLISASVATATGQTKAAIEFLFESSESHRLSDLIKGDVSHKDFLSEMAVRAAKKRHAQDPKQAERRFVFECWCNWRQKPEVYKSKAAFARDMLSKCENLESQKVIEDWCRLWEKENK